MFKGLKRRWQVNGINLALILCTFALGGSLCGFAGKKLLAITGLEKGWLWILLYVIVVSLLWPFCVLLVSIPLGQFSFFQQYLNKIGRRMTGDKQTGTRVAIFASGAGSNAQKIIEYSKSFNRVTGNFRVCLVVCNRPGAGVFDVAANYNIETLLIDKERFFKGDAYISEFKARSIDFIVLAGFLWKVPPSLIRAYPDKIINIHPALLPKYGGKGMYGGKVHEAIIAAGEKESGITIHYVDELYDHGKIIFQANCTVDENDTAETLAKKIHLLEHKHYPEVIENILKMQNSR
jgi:formyltetrahydrofolate-dependent phosphoribosylglycinamide formyltransferase